MAEPLPSDETPVQLPTLQVSSTAGDLLGRREEVTLKPTGLPSAMTVIEPSEIETINVSRDISNVFRRVPGLVAHNVDQGDTGNGFKMRGFATQGSHGADTAVYVDGVPQNLPSSEAGAGHGPAFLEWLTPTVIGGITVIKGPVSALYGDQNRAGAVEISTRAAATTSSVTLTAEAYDGRRGNVVLSGGDQELAALLIADSYRSDSFRDEAETERDNLFVKLSAVRGDARYDATLHHYKSDYTAAGFLLHDRLAAGLVEPESAQENALPGFGENRQTGLTLNRSPANGEHGFYANLYVEELERQRGGIVSDTLHNVGNDDRHFYGGRAAHNFLFGETTALFVGVDARRDSGDAYRQRYQNYLPTDLYLVNLELDLLTYGAFLQAQHKLTDTVKLLGGLRHDRFDYDIVNRKLPDASTEYRDGVTTPKLGLVWSVMPTLDLYTNVAEGFRSPAAQQISPGGALGPLGAAGGTTNTNIGASKVRSYDAGFTAGVIDWTLAGAFFYTENEDEVVMTAPDTFDSVGETTRRGYEIEARGALIPQLTAYLSYTRILQAEIDNPLPGTGALLSVAKHVVKGGIEHRHPISAGELVVNVDAYLTDGIPYYAGTPLSQREMPRYERYDLRVGYGLEHWNFSTFWIHQPEVDMSEAAYATTAGLWVSPQPRNHWGVSVGYQF